MFKQTKQKAKDLAKELKREIQIIESELNHKKQLLASLDMFEAKPGLRGRYAIASKQPAGIGVGRGRRAMPKRRRSKNRDAILAAASKLEGKFSLAELIAEIHKKDPKFGGKYPSGTILAAFRTTPEIKKLKRGTYSYKG
ncbi:MAG: hypothetical protein NTY09_14830 [bacterium]|nr:hypothetical protein [bacterium]